MMDAMSDGMSDRENIVTHDITERDVVMELKDLRFYRYLREKDLQLAVQVESVYNATKETINSITACYDNYTMHDIGHCLRVASYMETLSCGVDDFESNLNEFNAFEVALMLLASLLHDIGMFIRPEDRERIKKNDIPYTNSLTFEGVMDVVGGVEEEAIKEIVRITHAQRINEYIDFDFNGKTIAGILQLDDKYGYADDVVSISVAHGENYDYLRELRSQCTKGNYTYNLQYIAAMLRIADYLDLDKQRTPILWYKMMRIDGFSKEEWEKHFVVHNERKFKKYIGDKLQIYFEGKSSNAKIHRRYLAYVDELRMELERADELLNYQNVEKKYLFRVSTKVDDCVVTEGFKYSDLRLNLDYSSITELLMGSNIYGDKRLGLRELIQNSLDACHLMKEIYEKEGDDEGFEPKISILVSQKHGYVKIKDTGIGMTIDVVRKHFLNVGKSYYKSNEFKYASYEYRPIGQFGIGFLACFLLSDNVTVKTKFYKSNEIHQIELEKNSEYVVTNTEETGAFCGTEITLDYNTFFKRFSGINEIVDFLREFFYTKIPIVVRDMDKKESIVVENSRASDIISEIHPEESKDSFEEICCEEFSSKLEGIIRIQNAKYREDFEIRSLEEKKLYLFNANEGRFELLTDLSNLSNGYYKTIEYSQIDKKQYRAISRSRRNSETKRSSILKNSDSFFLLIPNGVGTRYSRSADYSLEIETDNKLIKDIIIDSGLDYYKELINDTDCLKCIFVYDRKYIMLQTRNLYGSRFKALGLDTVNIIFYNKGILIKGFFGILIQLPIECNIRAVVNYVADGVKLDVSRNDILGNLNYLENEVEKIILKYLSKGETRSEYREIIDAMICCIEAL